MCVCVCACVCVCVCVVGDASLYTLHCQLDGRTDVGCGRGIKGGGGAGGMTDRYLPLVPLSLAKWVIGNGRAVTQHTSARERGTEQRSRCRSVERYESGLQSIGVGRSSP